ncbi:hypothetical protein BURKHO8Y_450044 [Burkholderia sp. 8Y]|nr:hypothetical protein BURKHO8Y_450044 [Burkholderia sp. 8Y]
MIFDAQVSREKMARGETLSSRLAQGVAGATRSGRKRDVSARNAAVRNSGRCVVDAGIDANLRAARQALTSES